MVKKVVMNINWWLLIWTTLLMERKQMFYLFVPMLLLNVLFSCCLFKKGSDAARACFYKTGIYVVINVYFAMSIILETVNVQKYLLTQIMLAVLFVMLTSLFTIVPCGITYYIVCILKRNDE